MMAHTHAALWWRQCIPACLHLLATRILAAASMWQDETSVRGTLRAPSRVRSSASEYCGSGEQVGAGLDTNRIARKRFNGLESHPRLLNAPAPL
jgi:hypothetical protein